MDQEPDHRLPIELQDHIFADFILGEVDYPSKRDFQNTLLSFSLVNHHFRTLALPHLFKSFSPSFKSRNGQPWFSAFCHAWTTGDEHALALIPHIQHCTLDNAVNSGDENLNKPKRLSYTEAYLAALRLLPNLSSLFISAGVKLPLLHQLFETWKIQKLSLTAAYGYTDQNPSPIKSPRLNTAHFMDLANIIATHARDVQTLEIRGCAFAHYLFRLRPSFPLTTFRIQDINISDMEAFRGFVSSIPTLKELLVYHAPTPEPSHFEPGDLPNLEYLKWPRDWCGPIINSARLTKLRSLATCSEYMGTEEPTFDEELEEAFHRAIQVFCGNSLRSLYVPAECAHICCGPHLPYLEELTINLGDYYIYAYHNDVYSNSSELAWDWAKSFGYGYCNMSNTEGFDSQYPKTNGVAMWGHLTYFCFDYNMQDSFFSKSSFPFNLVEQRQLITEILEKRFPRIHTASLSPWVSWALSAKGDWIPSVGIDYKQRFMEALRAFKTKPPKGVPQNWTWHDWDVMQCLEQLMA